jgi:hypothetical protein
LKNAHLLRCGVRKVRRISHALHLNIFEQPGCIDFSNTRLMPARQLFFLCITCFLLISWRREEKQPADPS